MNQSKEDHYVYVLIDKENIFRYVGQGRGYRIKNTTQRSEQFREILKTGRLLILHDNLTKEQATKIENQYLEQHLKKKSEQWDLINKVKGRTVARISPELFNEHLKIDTSSPSGLIWLKDAVDKNGVVVTNRVGQPAGTKDKVAGYYKLMLGRVMYKVHRIVWSIHNNLPVNQDLVINHKDSDGFNNHPDNLELVTYQYNSQVAIRKPPRSGVVGVSIRANGDYRASIQTPKGRFSRYFSVRKYGKERAFQLACDWRKQKESEIT